MALTPRDEAKRWREQYGPTTTMEPPRTTTIYIPPSKEWLAKQELNKLKAKK